MRLLTVCKNAFERCIRFWVFKLHNIEYDETVRFVGVPKLAGKGKIQIGKNAKLSSGSRANPIGGDTRLLLRVAESATIKIGNNSGISNIAVVANESVIIGDYVFIGGGTKIYDTDFHSLNYDERISKPDPGIQTASVTIKDGAFIGAHSIILKGVTIGERSIVGAGSVVSKDIPDNEVWAGNPARRIRENLDSL